MRYHVCMNWDVEFMSKICIGLYFRLLQPSAECRIFNAMLATLHWRLFPVHVSDAKYGLQQQSIALGTSSYQKVHNPSAAGKDMFKMQLVCGHDVRVYTEYTECALST
jgi:hypothetical protein